MLSQKKRELVRLPSRLRRVGVQARVDCAPALATYGFGGVPSTFGIVGGFTGRDLLAERTSRERTAFYRFFRLCDRCTWPLYGRSFSWQEASCSAGVNRYNVALLG